MTKRLTSTFGQIGGMGWKRWKRVSANRPSSSAWDLPRRSTLRGLKTPFDRRVTAVTNLSRWPGLNTGLSLNPEANLLLRYKPFSPSLPSFNQTLQKQRSPTHNSHPFPLHPGTWRHRTLLDFSQPDRGSLIWWKIQSIGCVSLSNTCQWNWLLDESPQYGSDQRLG